jgi:hypothetical protein
MQHACQALFFHKWEVNTHESSDASCLHDFFATPSTSSNKIYYRPRVFWLVLSERIDQ